jgi:hypothetical protein
VVDRNSSLALGSRARVARCTRVAWALACFGLGAATACKPLEPDPVIKDGVELGPIQSFEAERIPGQGPHVANIGDSSASDGHALGIFSQRTAGLPLELLTEVSGFVVRAKGQECKGWPEMVVSIDGVPRLRTEVKTAGWKDYPGVAHLRPGMHQFDFSFTNDFLDASCDRNLFIDKMTFVNARATNQGDLRAVSMLLPGGVEVVDDPRIPGGKAVGFMSSSEATGETQIDRPMAGFLVRARADLCKGPPQMNITVDGIDRYSGMVESRDWIDVPVPVALAAGPHTLSIAFPNDEFQGPACDRNLYVEGLHFIESMPVHDGG